jgi:hypothetical protein
MIGLIPTPAETEAAMLEDLREWRRRQDDRNLEAHGAKLEREELDLLLAIADERDALLSQREEEFGDVEAPPYPPLSAKVTQPMPFVDVRAYPEEAEITPRLSAEERRRTCRFCGTEIKPTLIAKVFEHVQSSNEVGLHPATPILAPCTHESGTIEGGGIVCASCGLLLAWIRFDFRPSA